MNTGKKGGRKIMGMKDIALKDFESINEIFADIINAVIYKGEQVVHPEQLDQGVTFSTYYGDKGIRSQKISIRFPNHSRLFSSNAEDRRL